jgi:Glycosyl hydrolases family 38 C-terminal domain/Glycosyl hydrolases family 38 C-terminal beta sandwich domain
MYSFLTWNDVFVHSTAMALSTNRCFGAISVHSYDVKDATFSNDTTLYVFVYNPIAQNRSAVVRIPVASDGIFRVERVEEGFDVLVLRSVSMEYQHSRDTSVRYELVFDTDVLPPLGAVAFRIVKEPTRTTVGFEYQKYNLPKVQQRRLRMGSHEILELTNGIISASFDVPTGMLVDVTGDGTMLKLGQSWGYYTSFDSEFDSINASQNSGAYIFRPSVPDQRLIPLTPKLTKIVESAVGIEVHVVFEEAWVKQVTKLIAGAPYIEIEYTVGPIPIDDGRGKEIVTRFSTPIDSAGVCYTDSNGREFQMRKRNYRPTWNLEVFEPIAGNYYPVNAAIYIEDPDAALAIVVDRSQGGASLVNGSVELMVQRRTLADDSRGVDEPMNETCGGMTPYPPYGFNQRIGNGVVVSGRHRIRVGKGPVGASLARSEMDTFFAEPLVFVGSGPASEPVSFQNAVLSGLTDSLPANVMLVTFMRLPEISDNTFLVRFGHQYGLHEHDVLSQPVVFDISNIFVGFVVTYVVEMSLTGNQEWNDLQARRIRWNGEIKIQPSSSSTNGTSISICPMEIRTFKIIMTPQETTR